MVTPVEEGNCLAMLSEDLPKPLAITCLSSAFLACLTPAFVGPVTDFETAFGKMYAGYRSALSATNSGNAEKSVFEILPEVRLIAAPPAPHA